MSGVAQEGQLPGTDGAASPEQPQDTQRSGCILDLAQLLPLCHILGLLSLAEAPVDSRS